MTQAFWLDGANRAVNGMTLSLLMGAFCRLMEVQGEVLPSWKGFSLGWGLMCLAMVLGWHFDVPSLDTARYRLNAYLNDGFNSFDLADNPALIHRLNLAELLHSPPRQGSYADYLARKYPFQADVIEVRDYCSHRLSRH